MLIRAMSIFQGVSLIAGSLIPRPPTFFVLQFAFSTIHRSRILNANQRTKNGGGLGTRLNSTVKSMLEPTVGTKHMLASSENKHDIVFSFYGKCYSTYQV